jgi:hypothetical protein
MDQYCWRRRRLAARPRGQAAEILSLRAIPRGTALKSAGERPTTSSPARGGRSKSLGAKDATSVKSGPILHVKHYPRWNRWG